MGNRINDARKQAREAVIQRSAQAKVLRLFGGAAFFVSCAPPMIRLLLITSALLSLLTSAGSAATPERPNILFIIFDDWGPSSQAGINGGGWIKTHNFDRVAREGVLFKNAF